MSVLPGSILGNGRGEKCVAHEDRDAVKCVAGEVDAFGAEELYMCQECFDKFLKRREATRDGVQGYCEWCKTEQSTVKPYRDLDEGNHGPVYDVCQTCRLKHAKYFSDQDDRD